MKNNFSSFTDLGFRKLFVLSHRAFEIAFCELTATHSAMKRQHSHRMPIETKPQQIYKYKYRVNNNKPYLFPLELMRKPSIIEKITK